ncbi:MAG: hypothetical protein K6V97_04180 [Actinomycetia bacterium]|nr:hypothetical protein [Actinomycetes bacterium]
MTVLPGSECVPIDWWECGACGRRFFQSPNRRPGWLGAAIGAHWLIAHGRSVTGRYHYEPGDRLVIIRPPAA